MNVFQVCADRGIPPDGTKGASVHLRAMAAALTGRGHSVTTFAAQGAGAFPVDLRTIGELDAGATTRPDVILERYSLGHDCGLRTAQRLGCPFVLEVNAPLVDEASKHRRSSVRPADALVERLLLKEADLVVAVSEPLRRWVAAVRGSHDGTAVLRNGCDPSLYPHPAPIDPDSPPTVVFLGHPKPWHGAERLPGLLVELRRRTEATPRLLVIGGGPGAESVMDAARRAGVGGVEVTGALPHASAAARLSEAWVGLAPYPPDPDFYFCPLKVVEYLAAGLPAVASDQGDVGALVGDAGILVDPADDGAYADAVASLLADPGRARRLGRRGRGRVLAEMTWDAVATRWEAMVGPLLGEAAA